MSNGSDIFGIVSGAFGILALFGFIGGLFPRSQMREAKAQLDEIKALLDRDRDVEAQGLGEEEIQSWRGKLASLEREYQVLDLTFSRSPLTTVMPIFGPWKSYLSIWFLGRDVSNARNDLATRLLRISETSREAGVTPYDPEDAPLRAAQRSHDLGGDETVWDIEAQGLGEEEIQFWRGKLASLERECQVLDLTFSRSPLTTVMPIFGPWKSYLSIWSLGRDVSNARNDLATRPLRISETSREDAPLRAAQRSYDLGGDETVSPPSPRIQVHRQIPTELGYTWEGGIDSSNRPIILTDMLGQTIWLPILICSNLKAFDRFLKFYFNDRPGRGFIDRGHYALTTESNDLSALVPLQSANWESAVKPGSSVEMSAVVRRTVENEEARRCPNCESPQETHISKPGNTCSHCGTWFTISEYETDHSIEQGPAGQVIRHNDYLDTTSRSRQLLTSTSEQAQGEELRYLRRIHVIVQYLTPRLDSEIHTKLD